MIQIFVYNLIFIAITFFTASSSFATIWQINNVGNDADFSSITQSLENESVMNGDTLYISGSTISYGDINISKKLNIIGSGYFLGDNQDTQANLSSAKVGTVTFEQGSEGSSITGMDVYLIQVSVDNITVKRNKIKGIQLSNSVTKSIKNILIVQNYITTETGIGHALLIHSSTDANEIIISNNIIISNSASYYTIYMHTNQRAIITNNVLIGNTLIHNSPFHNNINRTHGTNTFSNSDIKSNIGDKEQFGDIDGNNKANVDFSTVFIESESHDAKYQLSQNSPAIGAGYNGINCGAFDGTTPYILSGIPSIPTIYQVVAPAIASELSGMPVHIKVKSRN